MTSIRDRAHAAPASRKISEPFDAPWSGEGDAPDQLAVRDMGSEARMTFMSEVDAASGKVDMNSLLPFVTDLLVDPATGLPVFELSDHDWLVDNHPGLVSKTILSSITISDLGDVAAKSAEGNS